MWSISAAETIVKQITFRHLQLSRGNTYDFEVEKDHFQKSNVFAMSKRERLREITWRCSEKSHRPQDPSENHANTIGKRDVFENVPVAGDILRFRARQTLGIHAFLSSSA